MDPSQTVLMDETAVYFEDARDQTVDVTGSRHVVVRSTGFASMRITVILAITAAGRKLAPVLIWKGKDKASFDKVEGVYVTYQKKAWVDSNLLKRWIDMQFPLVNVSDGKYLVWDSMRAHVSKEVKAKCNMRGIKMCVIPGGLTPYLQAGDIGIYRYFKDILYAEITAWKESDQVTYTKAEESVGRQQSPQRWIDMQFPLVNVSDGKYLVWDSMRALVSKEVKAKCNMRGIKMCVIPGGLTPYLQAGGIGIYRYFKDILYAEITAWKESDQVTYTKAGNPRPPPVTTVCAWVRKAWTETNATVVENSVSAAGFADRFDDWFIAGHDVYGESFKTKYSATLTTAPEREEPADQVFEDSVFNVDEMYDALDEVSVVIDE
ncbi:hypothetical protein P43SY_004355 [Pythium insidiosum]|uniref:DDE-1 domain-containing protein n=1 Tax=Pythium insidiosum TaxID=114742 RepID=A0AAD5M1N6_PYTIN|nr:hypothetical protein P43SY_004355 [Pythium insidiosum]